MPKRTVNAPPVQLLTGIDKYELITICLRQGHEVLEAESKDFWFIFSPRTSKDIYKREPIQYLLPPNPALIRNFIGRIDVLSELLNWVVEEDEPRKFLYGRGGSSKSTAAYEFSKIIRDNGRYIEICDGKTFDRVVFLSAKKSLRSSDEVIIDNISTDFSIFDKLQDAMIESRIYSDSLELKSLNRKGLLDCLIKIF